MSNLSKVTNEAINTLFRGAIYGRIGYLSAHLITNVDPVGALICAAVAGATSALCFNPHNDTVRKIAGLILLIGARFLICESLHLAMSLQKCLIVTGVTEILAIFIQQFKEEDENDQFCQKINSEIDMASKKMKDDFNANQQEIDDELKTVNHVHDYDDDAHSLFLQLQQMDQHLQFHQQQFDHAMSHTFM